MSAPGTHAVKVRRPGEKRWSFLRSNGATTHLRIHAALASEERCKEYAQDIAESNPGVETRVVSFWKES
jgi:hypothetical protein